jgi:hypothetical protein
MSSDDYWRNKQKEDRRREVFYDAMRERDYDAATREASPDTYLDYLRLKDSQSVQPPGASSQQVAALTEERKNLVELIERTSLDIHGRIRLIQMVHAVDPSSPGANEKFDQMRMHIEKYI